MKSKMKYSIIAIVCFLVIVLPVSFSLLQKDGSYQIIEGLSYDILNKEEVLTIQGIKPLDDETGMKQGAKLLFNLKGNVDGEAYVNMNIVNAESLDGYTRFNKDAIKYVLKENNGGESKIVFGPATLDNNTIFTKILREKRDHDINYELVMWVSSDKVLVSDKINFSTGKQVFKENEYEKLYNNIKLKLDGGYTAYLVNKEFKNVNNSEISGILSESKKEVMVTKSLTETPYVNEDIVIDFISPNMYKEIYFVNTDTGEVEVEEMEKQNSITYLSKTFDHTGTYLYYGVNGKEKTETGIINVKIDKVDPSFEMEEGIKTEVLDSKTKYEIVNNLSEIVEDNTYNIYYSLRDINDPNQEEDFKLVKGNVVKDSRSSGIYELVVKMVDNSGKEFSKKTTYEISYPLEIIDESNKIGNLKINVVAGMPFDYIDEIPTINDYYFKGFSLDKKASFDLDKNTVPKLMENLYFLWIKEYTKVKKLNNSDCNDLYYIGKEQLLLDENESYKLFNYKQINAGTYDVTVRLNDSYIWDDDTKEDLTLKCNINKVKLVINTKSDYKLYDGLELFNSNYELVSGELKNNDKIEINLNTKISNIGKVKNKVDSYSIKNGTIDVTNNYDVEINEGYLEILSRQIVKPTNSLCNDLTYNGKEQNLIEEEYGGYKFDITKGKLAGNYKLTAHLDDNYEWKDGSTNDVEITCKINKVNITVAADSDYKVYDGTYLNSMSGDITKGTLVEGHTLVSKSSSQIKDVGKIKNHLDDVKVIDENNVDVTSSYNISLIDGTLEIKKRDLLITPDKEQFKYYGDKDTNITYKYSNNIEGDNIEFKGSIVKSKGESIGKYEIINKDLKVLNNNYSIVLSNNITYEIKEKPISELEIKVLDKNFIYDGNEKKPRIEIYHNNKKIDSDNYVITYSNNINVGTGKIYISGKNNYNGVYENTFDISKRELTVKVDSNLNKGYKDVDPIFTYKVLNTIEGEEPVFTGNLERDPGEDIGKYLIKEGNLELGSSDTFDKNNYNFKVVGNTFEITKKDFTNVDVILEYESIVYNGLENKPSVNIKDNGEVLDTSCYEISYSNNINVGNGIVTIKGINNYQGTIKKTFSITKKSIKVTMNSKSKVYDGTKLTDHTYSFDENSLVKDHTLRVIVNTSITNVGTIDNVPASVNVIYNKNKVTDNYDIEIVNGKLEVIKAEMKFDVTNYKSEYDGKNHSIKLDYSKDYNVTIYYSNSSIDETNYSTLNKGLNYKDVGTHTVYFYAHDNTGNYKDYNSSDYNNNGKIEITKKELVPTAKVSPKVYDGNNKATCLITLSGVVNNDKLEVISEGTYEKTNVGTNIVTCTNIRLDGDNLNNYNLKTDTLRVDGEITKKKIKPLVSINTKNYDAKVNAYGDFKLEGVIDTDDVLLDGECSYIDKNSGTDKKVTCLNFKLSGNSKDNYELDTNTYITKGSINKKNISVSSFEYNNTNKEYDGNNLNTKLTITSKELLDNDKIKISYAKASYDDYNVDKASIITITGITIDNQNYKLDKTDYTVKGNITKSTFIPKVSITDFIYGEYKEPSISNNLGNANVTYYYNTVDSNKDGIKYDSNTKLDSGIYYLYAQVSESNNYFSVNSNTVKFNVKKQINNLEVKNYETMVDSLVELDKLVSNNKGSLTYEIIKQTTNNSYIKNNKLYVGTNSDKDDLKKTIIIKVIDSESKNYLSSSNIININVDKYDQTLNFDRNNLSSINYNDNNHKINVVSETTGEKGIIYFESTDKNILDFNKDGNIITNNSGTCKVKVIASSTSKSKKSISYINITVNKISGNIKLNKNSDYITYLDDEYVIKIDDSTSTEFDIETNSDINYHINGNLIYLSGLSSYKASSNINIRVIGKSNSRYKDVNTNFTLTVSKKESSCSILSISDVFYPSNNKGYIEYSCTGAGTIKIKNNKYIDITNIKDNKIYFVTNNIGTDNIKLVLNAGNNYLGYELDNVSININPSTYTIYFHDEIDNTQSKEVTYGDKYGELYIPNISNKKFLGWYLDREYLVKVNDYDKVKLSSNTILYAKYNDSIPIERPIAKKNIFQKLLDLFKK